MSPLMRPLMRDPFEASLDFNPRQLFTQSEPGAHFEVVTPAQNVFAQTMYQDSAGTTLVTAVEQPVGLWLDTKVGTTRGAELWSDGAVTLQGESTRVSAGVYRIYSSAGAFSSVRIAGGATVGKTYEITFTIDSIAVAGNGITIDWATGQRFNTTGQKRCIVVASTTDLPIRRDSAGVAVDYQISNVSFRELPGNHITQGTTPSRPTDATDGTYYFQRFDGIDDNLISASGGGGTAGFLFCAAVTVSGGSGAARTLWSDAGTNTGYRVRINASNQLELAAGNGTAFTSVATVATLPVTETHVATAWDDGTNLNVQIDNGAIASVARPAVAAGTSGFTMGRDNGAATSFFNGRMYSDTYRQSDCGDTKRAMLKRWHGQKAGLSL